MFLRSLEVVFDSRVNVNNGRWKRILRINSSKCIKKVMWVCTMRRDNLTSSGPVSFHSVWNILSIVFLHNCVPEQQHTPPKAMTACVSSARSEPQVIWVTLDHKTSHKGLLFRYWDVCITWTLNKLYFHWCMVYDRNIFEKVQKNRNIEKIIFKVVQMKFLAMHINNQKLSWYIYIISSWNMILIF